VDRRSTLVYLVAGAAVASSAWATFVPDSISGSTFGWILVVTIGLFVVSTIATRSSRPSSSVAHVLYEAEHPPAVSAQRGALSSDATDTR
jgi:tetrahydromethanopterin S-methyltransferase subunit E